MAKYLFTFLCILIFIRIDPNQIPFFLKKLIRTNIHKLLQFTRVNLRSVNGAPVLLMTIGLISVVFTTPCIKGEADNESFSLLLVYWLLT